MYNPSPQSQTESLETTSIDNHTDSHDAPREEDEDRKTAGIAITLNELFEHCLSSLNMLGADEVRSQNLQVVITRLYQLGLEANNSACDLNREVESTALSKRDLETERNNLVLQLQRTRAQSTELVQTWKSKYEKTLEELEAAEIQIASLERQTPSERRKYERELTQQDVLEGYKLVEVKLREDLKHKDIELYDLSSRLMNEQKALEENHKKELSILMLENTKLKEEQINKEEALQEMKDQYDGTVAAMRLREKEVKECQQQVEGMTTLGTEVLNKLILPAGDFCEAIKQKSDELLDNGVDLMVRIKEGVALMSTELQQALLLSARTTTELRSIISMPSREIFSSKSVENTEPKKTEIHVHVHHHSHEHNHKHNHTHQHIYNANKDELSKSQMTATARNVEVITARSTETEAGIARRLRVKQAC